MRLLRPATAVYQGFLAVIFGGGGGLIAHQAGARGALWWGVGIAAVVLALGLRRAVRRWWVVRRPFPAAWRRWLASHVALYERLDAAGRRRFERDVQIYLAEQRFEYVEGVARDPLLELAVAAGAALLLAGRPDWELPTRRTVLFYPDRFDDLYEPDTRDADFDGMVHPQGPLILSAPAVREGWAYAGDGNNVVLHELAHLFDFGSAFADGLPTLMDPASARAWQQLVQREMRTALLGKSLLRRYAAHDAAEFFAVAVENFFDRPERLAERHPDVFAALSAFFQIDPTTGRPPAPQVTGPPLEAGAASR